MAELLVKGVDSGSVSGLSWMQGQPVVVMEDGHQWGAAEVFPAFAVLKLPGVPVERLQRFLDDDVGASVRAMMERGENPPADLPAPTIRRNLRLRWADLPAGAKTKIKANGGLTILVPAFGYTGPYDYTWAQVKTYWHNTMTNTDDAGDL